MIAVPIAVEPKVMTNDTKEQRDRQAGRAVGKDQLPQTSRIESKSNPPTQSSPTAAPMARLIRSSRASGACGNRKQRKGLLCIRVAACDANSIAEIGPIQRAASRVPTPHSLALRPGAPRSRSAKAARCSPASRGRRNNGLRCRNRRISCLHRGECAPEPG